MNKLSSLDIPFVLHRWLSNYRLQRVVLNGAFSPWLPVKSGVPQGSVLGPLFFLSYINDLASLTFSRGTQILLFADDIVLYKLITNDQDTANFQADVDLVANWAKLNHLELNSSKTNLMFITRSCVSAHQFFFHSVKLHQVHHFKYLGVWLSRLSHDLSWEKHIQYVTNKARRHLGYIFRTFLLFCCPESLVRLYRTQVLPLLDYGCVVWDPHLSKHKQLEKVQVFATRMAAKQWNESAETLNRHFNLPPLTTRLYFKLLYYPTRMRKG